MARSGGAGRDRDRAKKDTTEMKAASRWNRGVRAAFGSAIVILVVVGAVSYREIALFRKSSRSVMQTTEVVGKLQDLRYAVHGAAGRP